MIIKMGIRDITRNFSILDKYDYNLQCFCTQNSGCDIFLTSDKKFIDCGIKIVDSKNF